MTNMVKYTRFSSAGSNFNWDNFSFDPVSLLLSLTTEHVEVGFDGFTSFLNFSCLLTVLRPQATN